MLSREDRLLCEIEKLKCQKDTYSTGLNANLSILIFKISCYVPFFVFLLSAPETNNFMFVVKCVLLATLFIIYLIRVNKTVKEIARMLRRMNRLQTQIDKKFAYILSDKHN